MRKKILAALVLGSLVAIPVLEARLRRISIGTNPVGTIYFVVGGGIAKLFTKELRVPARAVPHAGSSVYLTLLDRGELTLGLNTSLDSALAALSQSTASALPRTKSIRSSSPASATKRRPTSATLSKSMIVADSSG